MTDKKFTEEEIIKANNILDKLDFFNQRAGRELWNEKPVEIQDVDIRNREEDIKFLKDLINRQQSEIKRLKSANDEKFRQWDMLAEKTKQHYANLYEEAKDILKAEAYKECIEKVRKLAVGMHPCSDELRVFDSDLDNILKMVGEIK